MRPNRRFRSSGNTTAVAIALDRSGVIHIAGRTTGTVPGPSKAGGGDAFVLRLERMATAEIGSTLHEGTSE